jgi:hypothetical protein
MRHGSIRKEETKALSLGTFRIRADERGRDSGWTIWTRRLGPYDDGGRAGGH